MKTTKKQLEKALELVITDTIDGPEYCLMFKSTVHCGKFGYCGGPKCVKAQMAHFIAKAKED
jgi:hypothetical protein